MEDKYQTEINPSEPEFEEVKDQGRSFTLENTSSPQLGTAIEYQEIPSVPGISVDWTNVETQGDIVATEEEETYRQDDDLRALQDLVTMENKKKSLRVIGSSFARELNKSFEEMDRPIIPIDQLDTEMPDTVGYARDMAPTEEQRQKSVLESIGGGHWVTGFGNTLIASGEDMKNKGFMAAGEKLIEQGRWYIANAPKRDVKKFADVDSLGKLFKFGMESAEEGGGSSLPYLAAGGAATAAGYAATPALVALGQNLGAGQAIITMKEQRDELLDKAQEAKRDGNPMLSQYYQYEARNLDPDKNFALVQAAGLVIGTLDIAVPDLFVFRGAPTHLVDKAKKILVRRALTHLASKGVGAGVTEAVTEVAQDLTAEFAVMRAKGLSDWIAAQEAVDEMFALQADGSRKALESGAAGFFGGAGMGAVGASTDLIQVARAGRGAASGVEAGAGGELPTELPAPLPPELMQPQTPAAPEQKPLLLDTDQEAKLRSYLANPENLTRPKDYERIGKELGISPEKVPSALDAFVEDGTLRKDNRGIYRRDRVEPAKPIIPETGEAAGESFILPEPADETVQEATQEPVQPEVVPAPAGEVQAPVAEAQAGPSSVAMEIDPANQIAGIEAQIESKRQQLADVRSGLKGASPEERSQIKETSDSLRKEIKALQKELKAAEEAPAKVAQPQEEAKSEMKKEPWYRPEGGLSLIPYLTRGGGLRVPKDGRDMRGKVRPNKTRARGLFGNELPPSLFVADSNPKGRSLDGAALWDDLVEGGYIPPYIQANGELIYDPYERIVDLINQEIGGQRVYSERFDRGSKTDRSKDEHDVYREASYHLENITPTEEARLYELVLDQGVTTDDAIEIIAKEYVDGLDNIATSPQQSPVSQERAGEGQRPEGEGNAPAVREGNAQPGQEGLGGGLLTRKDIIPFAVFRNERAKSAVKLAEKIEQALRKGLGLTEEDKTKRLISKIKPLTKNGKAIQIKLFDRSLKSLSPSEQAFVREAEGSGANVPVFAFYNYDTSTIALSLYAAADAGDTARSFLSHEVVHALVDIGVITRAEVSLLAKEAEKLGSRAMKEIERAYTHLYRRQSPAKLAELIQEEKAAFLVQIAMDRDIKSKESLIKDIIERIKEVLQSIRAAFRGGGDQEKITWLDVIQTLVDTKIGSGKAGPYVNQDELTQAIEKIRADLRKEDLSKPNTYLAAIKAYHGSPHDFEYFDLSKIGTGEGNQAYGRGAYFAESKDVGLGYKDKLSNTRGLPYKLMVDGKEVPVNSEIMRRLLDDIVSNSENGEIPVSRLLPDMIRDLNDLIEGNSIYEESSGYFGREEYSYRELTEEERDEYVMAKAFFEEILHKNVEIVSGGVLYEVRINADQEQFLDWDKPLNQQSEAARSAVQPLIDQWLDSIRRARYPAGQEPSYVTKAVDGLTSGLMTAGEFYKSQVNLEKANGVISEAGILGIRYLDGNSRGSGQGTYNYVVFDESIIEIVSKNGEPVNRKPVLAALKITKDDAPQGKSVTDIVNEVADEMAAKPAPVIGTKKPTLSIPGLKRPQSPAEAGEAKRLEREEKNKVLGPLPPSSLIADMTGLPLVGFQADIQHILDKRDYKDDTRYMVLPQSLEEVRANINRVLEDPHFGYVHHTGNITIVHRTDDRDYVVAIKRKVSGHEKAGGQYIEMPTAFVLKKGEIDKRLIGSLVEGGLDNLFWGKGAAEIDRLLYIVRQARGPGSSPFISDAIRELQKEQLALKGVKPTVLAALSSNPNNPKPVKGINTIIRELAEGLNVTLKQGYGPQWGYKSRSGVIRQKAYYDFSQLAQNIAPLLEQRHNWVRPAIAQNAVELGSLVKSLDPDDGYRAFMELYLSSPSTALQRAPNFYEAFEDFMEVANPEHLAVLQTTQLALEEYQRADPTAAVESMITPMERTTRVAKIKKAMRKDGVYDTIKNGLLYVYSNVVASDAPMVSGVRQILDIQLEKTGERRWLKAIENPSKLLRRMPHAQSIATMDIKFGIRMKDGKVLGPGLPDVLAKALGSDMTEAIDLRDGKPYSHFLSYIVSLRAKQLWEKYLDGGLERSPTIIQYETFVKAIADLEARYPEFKQAQRMLNQFTRALLKLKYDFGLISFKDYTKLNEDQFYIPFQRSFEEELTADIKSGKSVSTDYVLKKFRGSNRDIIDPVAMLIQDVYATRHITMMNQVVEATLKIAEEAGPEAGRIIERINPKKTEAILVNLNEAVESVAKEQGLSSIDTQNLLQHVVAELGTDALATIFKKTKAEVGGKPIVFFMENGKLQAASLNDPSLAKMMFDSLNLFGEQHYKFIFDLLAAPTQLTRFTITTNPSYILSNAIRDAFHAPSYERKMVPFLSQAVGAYRIAKGDPLLNEYIRAGGIMGGVGAAGMDQTRMDASMSKLIAMGYGVNKFTSASDFIRHLQTTLEYTETASRIQLYKIAKERALAQGLTELEAEHEAAFHANDYCDYSRHGMKTEPLRKTIAFWNASIQGLDRFRKTLAGVGDQGSVFGPYLKYKMGKGQKLTPGEMNQLYQSMSAWTYYIAFLGSISFLIWSMYHDDERLRDIPDEIKSSHFVIPLDGTINLLGKDSFFGGLLDKYGGSDDLLRLPKPFESAWVANFVERFLWERKKGDPLWLEKWRNDVYDSTLPPMKPAFMNFYDIFASRQDPQTGRPLESSSMRKMRPEDRYTPYTSEVAKTIGQATGSSPVIIDAALKAAGTSWARDLLALNIPGTPWHNDKKPSLGLDEFVMARRFLWQVGKGSPTGQVVREMMGEEDIVSGIFRRTSFPYSRLSMNANSYSRRTKELTQDSANRLLAEVTPRERGYAILMRGLEGRSAKYEKLDPMNRAWSIGQAAFQIQREMASGILVVDKGNKKEGRAQVNSNVSRAAIDIMTQIQMQEYHNGLVLTEEPGYAKSALRDTSGLYDELKVAAPEVYAEFKRRMDKAHVLPFEGIKAVWPTLKTRLESLELYKDAQEGNPEKVQGYISDLWFKAKYPVAKEGALAQ